MTAVDDAFGSLRDPQLLLEHVSGVFLALDREGLVRVANRSACEMLGGSEEEIVGRNWFDSFLFDGDREALREGFRDLVAGRKGDASARENAVRTLSGGRRIVSWQNRVVRDTGGRVAAVVVAGVDLTEQMEAIDRLRHGEALLSMMGRIARIGGWEVDPITRMVTWTEEIYRIYGLAPGTPINIDHAMMYYPPAAREQVARAMKEAIRDGRGFDLETPFENVRGERLWVHMIGRPVMEDGRVVKIWGTLQDTTRRRQYEESLRESESALARMEEISQIASWNWDIEEDILEGTEQFYHLLGRDPRTTLLDQEAILAIIHPEDREETAHLMRQTIEQHAPYSVEHRIVLPDGSVRWLQCQGRLTLNTDGGAKRLFGTSQDVTDRVIRERERMAYLERVRRQQQALLEIASAGAEGTRSLEETLAMLARKGAATLGVERVGIWRLDDANGQLVNLVQYIRSSDSFVEEASLPVRPQSPYFQAIGTERTIDACNAGEDRRFEQMREAYLQPRGIQSILDAAIRLEGRLAGVICFEHTGEPRHWHADEIDFAGDAAGQAALALSHEERRRLEARMLHSQKLESLGVLAGGIAHDFNNLLMAILGNADLALQDLEPGHPARDCLGDIEVTARRAADLCRQMLAYSGKGRFELSRVDLSTVVREMSGILDVSISKKARLVHEFAPSLPAVEADPAQMRQIVMNLILNASEALGDVEGKITVRTSCTECAAREAGEGVTEGEIRPGRHVLLEVADTGCGMDEATRGRIFDPFFTTKFTGRGLGLAAVLGIVRGHGGGIEVASSPGAGTSVRVYLPACGGRPVHTPHPVPSGPAEWEAGGLALLVDDEEIVRTVGSRMLQRLGFEVVTADDGEHALEVFGTHAPRLSLVVLDLTMPRRDGEQVLVELRRTHPELPILLSSGYNEQELAQRFAGHDRCGFIQKPYVMRRLRDKIQELMDPA